jgi:hypothetical protein
MSLITQTGRWLPTISSTVGKCRSHIQPFRRYMSTAISKLKHSGLLYNVLKVTPESTPLQIKLKYYQACQQYHPDHGGSITEFLGINKAYQILSNNKQRSSYDNLDHVQHQEFQSIWTAKFNPNLTKIEEINQYLKDRKKLESSWGQSVINSVVSFVATRVKNHYQGLVVVDLKKQAEYQKRNSTRHIYFILDVSRSMFNWDSSHPSYRSVPSKYVGKCIMDGVEVSSVEIEARFHHIIEEAKYFNQCVKNFKSIHKALVSQKYPYIMSCLTFSDSQQQQWTCLPVNDIKDYHFGRLLHSTPKPAEFTHIYDTLKTAILNTESISASGSLNLTTFMLFTDGSDFGSQTNLDELLDLIREKGNINLIILTQDPQNCQQLQKIVNVAKSGKLLKIGDRSNRYGFESVEQAFSSAKDLILSDGYVSFIDLRQTFDL